MGNRLSRGVFVMKRAGMRVFLAACTVLLVGIGIVNVPSSSAQDETWTLELSASYCPADHEAGDGWNECTIQDTHIAMDYYVVSGEFGSQSFESDAGGTLVAELPAPGQTGNVAFVIPTGVAGLEFSCAKADGSDVSAYTHDRFLTFEDESIAAGDYVSCAIYWIPATDAVLTTGMAVAVAYCDADPRIQGNSVYDICFAVPDVRVIFTDSAGNDFDECLTVPGKIEGGSSAGVCGIQVPLGSTTSARVDLSTTSDDYTLISKSPQIFEAPTEQPDGILGFPYFQFVANDALADDEDVPAEPVDDDPAPAQTVTPVEGRTVILHAGDCDAIGDEVATLSDVLPEDGDVVGDEKAIPAELSVTKGALFFLDAAIDEGMALVVYEDASTDTPVACGDLGGVNTHDGMLPIGLGEIDDSGIVGTAVLSYNAADESTTDVTIVISADLLPKPTETPGA
jgi:hypothetical protein